MKFLIVGRTGTGKDYLRSILEKKYGWTFVKSYTTRPRRSDDENTHIFVTKEEAARVPDNEKVAKTIISGYEYYATREQVWTSDGYIIDPRGLKMLLENMPDEDFFIVYLYADKDKQKQMAVSRASDPEKEMEIFEQRYKSEDHQFSEFEDCLDHTYRFHFDNIDTIMTWENNYKKKEMKKLAKELEGYRTKANDTVDKNKTKLEDKDIIWLSLLLNSYMSLLDQYNESDDTDTWKKFILMQDDVIAYMNKLSFNHATIGAILAECGGAYWYNCTNWEEEDTDIVDLFTLDKIKERLQDYYKESISEDTCKIFNEAKTKEENKMRRMYDIMSKIDEIERTGDDIDSLKEIIHTDDKTLHFENKIDGHIIYFDKDDLEEIINIRKRKVDNLLKELKDILEDAIDDEEEK